MELLENGLDSLKRCVGTLKQVDNTSPNNTRYEFMLKDVIINLHHSTETLFKYLINIKSEYLLYDNLGSYFKQMVENKLNNSQKEIAPNTIQFLDAVNYVLVLYNVDMEKTVYNQIKILNDNRNALTHYTFTFTPKETENYIALLLPELFKIYSSYILEFDSFAKSNRLYEDIEKLREKNNVNGLKQIFDFINKWDLAESKIEVLNQKPENITKVFKNLKRNSLYSECPCCKKNTLYVTSTCVINSLEKHYLGECEYCGLIVDLEDAKLLALQFQSFTEIEKIDLYFILKSYLSGCLLIYTDGDSDLIDRFCRYNHNEISNIISQNRDSIVEDMRIKYQYLMDDVCTYLAEDYFHANYYYKNDIVERHAENNDLDIELEFYEAIEKIDKEIYEEKVMPIKLITERLRLLDPIASDMLIKELATTYISYHQGMYINWNQADREVEFTIRLTINETDLDDVEDFIGLQHQEDDEDEDFVETDDK